MSKYSDYPTNLEHAWDRVKELEARCARYKEALEAIAKPGPCDGADAEAMERIAREALNEPKG